MFKIMEKEKLEKLCFMYNVYYLLSNSNTYLAGKYPLRVLSSTSAYLSSPTI